MTTLRIWTAARYIVRQVLRRAVPAPAPVPEPEEPTGDEMAALAEMPGRAA